jgi:hypothetical protein
MNKKLKSRIKKNTIECPEYTNTRMYPDRIDDHGQDVPRCSNPDCNGRYAHNQQRRKDGSIVYRKNKSHKEKFGGEGWICASCHLKTCTPTSYRKYVKEYCENVDGRLGFVCTTSIIKGDPFGTLECDHIDGDPSNNEEYNIQTLCSCCHKVKTGISGDAQSPGRKSLGIKK